MYNSAKTLYVILALALFAVILPFRVLAEYQIYSPGASVTVGDFVYDDSFNPTTTPCSVIIADPSGNQVASTSVSGDATGWHAYTFTPVPVSGPTSGVWPATLSCGGTGTGDLVREDRSFIVGYAAVDTTTINSNINAASSSIGSLIGGLNNYSTTTLASAVWSIPGRSLDLFTNLVQAIWGNINGDRTLTAFGNLAADVWNNTFAPNRELTDQNLTNGAKIATQTDITNASSTIMAAVLNNATLISNLNNISAADVWANATRTLTSISGGTVDLTASSTLAIWNEAAANMTSPGSIGAQIAANLDTTISSRGTATVTAANIWAAATRTLTDYSTSSVAAAVWANAARTLTNYGNNLAAADVWNVLASSLTTTGSIGAQVASVSTSTVASAVWNSPTRNLTDYATSSIASAVWTSPTRTLSSFGTLVSDITTSVWSNTSRTLTAFGSLAADVWNGSYAPTRELTDQTLSGGGNIATQTDILNASSSIITAELNNSTLINNLNNISAAQVWAYGARTITGGTTDLTASSTQAIWNEAAANMTSPGSIGAQIATNLDTTISSRGTATVTAASIWAAATRTLTDYATSSVASAAATAVWANAARTLTNYGNNIQASDVWNVLTSSLTNTGSIGAQVAGISTSTVASAVWNNPTRNLTDYGTSSIASAVWSSPTRSLTSFGTLVSDITASVWGNASRTLTAFGSLAADVWNGSYAPTRELTDQTLTSGGSIATQTDVLNASSTLMAAVLNNSTLINNLNNLSAAQVWAYGARSLNGSGGTVDLTASSTQAIWNVASSQLTSSGSVGQQLVNNLNATISSVGTATITAADVWNAATRTLTDYSTSSVSSAVASAVWANAARTLTSYGNNISAADVWNVLSSTLTTTGSIGQQVAGVSTSTIASAVATSVWNNPTRNLTDYATSSIASAVWTSPTRTLTALGSAAADVWNNLFAPNRELTDQTLTSGGKIATQTDVLNASSSIMTAELSNATLINNLNNLSAAQVWAYGTRALTTSSGGTVDLTASSTQAIWNVAAANMTSPGSIGAQIATNLDTTISSRSNTNLTAADIWNAATRTLTDYATSSVSSSVASAVWANAARTLTSYGNNISAADVWNVLTSSLTTTGSIGAQVAGISTSTIASGVWNNPTRTLTSYGSLVSDIWSYLGTSLHSGQSGTWSTTLSDTQNILAGNLYQATVYVTDSGDETDAYATPTITIYDTNRNVVVSNVSMSHTGTGIYNYSYSVPTGAVQGQWETVIQTVIDSNNTTIQTSDYWQVSGSPAQVIIRDMANSTVPTATADITITNEGSSGYEYQYDWCVVANTSDTCGSSNNIFYESAAKFIDTGQNWDTQLSANVPSAGNYYFKVVVYYGTESSGSSRTFTETTQSVTTPPAGGGGSGGGGGPVNSVLPTTPSPAIKSHNGANFKGYGKVDSTDFSILLYFWGTNPPFANPYVDINGDGQVNSTDFSILLYQWGGPGIPYKKP